MIIAVRFRVREHCKRVGLETTMISDGFGRITGIMKDGISSGWNGPNESKIAGDFGGDGGGGGCGIRR